MPCAVRRLDRRGEVVEVGGVVDARGRREAFVDEARADRVEPFGRDRGRVVGAEPYGGGQ